ncbi:MAG: c-type cytochrome [Caldilineaceae bacterium]|nr:c-type cytochrome [Caldilineaceae bacterium]
MEENSPLYSLITTVAGVLLATLLVAILGVTLFTWAGSSRERAAEAEFVVASGDGAEVVGTGAGAAASAPAVASSAGAASSTESAGATDETAVAQDTSDTAAAEAPAADSSAGSPVDVVAAITKATCITCHIIPGLPDPPSPLGPDLTHIGTVAATRVEGESAEEYIRISLQDPAAFTVSECPLGPCTAGLMQPAFAQMLTPDEFEAVVNYLLEQK